MHDVAVDRPDWRLNVYLDLYKVEFDRCDQITASLHSQWGYLTLLVTGVWLLAQDAIPRWSARPILTSIELASAIAGFVVLALATRLMLRVHNSANKLERLSSLADFEKYRDNVDERVGVTTCPDEQHYQGICDRLRDARDRTAGWNKEKGDILWKARGLMAAALGCIALMALVELLIRVGG
jgi:hypothetical protein